MIDGLKPYADCRDSGLPWLGKIPAHWEVRRTKTQFRLSIEKSGKAHGQELLSIYTHIGVRPRKDLEEKGNKASSTDDYWVVRKGDLIVNKLLAWMGAVGVSHYDGVTSPAYDILRPVKELVPDFYHYLFRTDLYKQQFKIRSRGIMEMRLRLYFDQFGQIPIPCPPPEEQAAIVRFLDHADRRIRRYIRAKRQLIALLNEQKQAIIHRAVTRGLDPHVKLKPSGVALLGEVPEHWEVARLRRLIQSRRGLTYGSLKPGEYDAHGRVMVRAQDFSFGWTSPEKVFRVSPDVEEPYKRCRLLPGDLLYTVVGAGVGNCAVVPQWLRDSNISRANARIAVDGSKAIPEFVVLTLRSALGKEHVEYFSKGSAQPVLNLEYLGTFAIPVPPLSEQSEILEAVNAETVPFDSATERANREIELLREHRTRLVADVVVGKLDVRKAAAALSDELETVEPDAEELLDEDETTDDAKLDTEPEEIEA
ncbi:MAG: restriction endonuclease subunit S [Nevskiaceae bacterium]|jgi:type I restriction enzyme S subunit|nr:MAG: restriction endonuclease subunit S [Nevskiaceae bacterium]